MYIAVLWIVILCETALLILEGFGIQLVHEYFVLISTPLLIISTLLILHKKMHRPSQVAVTGWILLISAVILSTFSSSMLKHQSLYLSFLYVHACVIFFLGNTYSEELRTILPKIIPWAAVALALASFFLNMRGMYIEKGEQLIYPAFGSHNHGGEMSAIGLILLMFSPHSLLIRIVIGFVLSLSFVLSFSKSAYIIFLIGLIIGGVTHIKSRYIVSFILFTLFFISVLFVITTKPLLVPQLQGVQSFLQTHIKLEPRPILSSRDVYLKQAVASMHKNMFWGSGAGSFAQLSRSTATSLSTQTNYAHNIFLEIGVEQGIVGLIGLILILIPSGIELIRNKRSVVHICFGMLFLLFQTDYTYALHGILLLFFLLGGVCTPNSSHKQNIVTPLIVTGVVLQIIWIDMLIGSMVALGYHNPRMALAVYPLSVDSYQSILKTLPYDQAEKYVDGYVYASPNTTAYLTIAQFYKKNDNKLKAALFFEKAFLSNPSLDLVSIREYVQLLNELHAKRQLEAFSKIFISTYNSYEFVEIPRDIYKQLLLVCNQIAPACTSIRWYADIQK